jgi:cyclase
MDRDGTHEGYDLELTRAVVERCGVPVIASGGVGAVDDIVRAFADANADGALVASLLHDRKATLEECKRAMERAGIPTRPVAPPAGRNLA